MVFIYIVESKRIRTHINTVSLCCYSCVCCFPEKIKKFEELVNHTLNIGPSRSNSAFLTLQSHLTLKILQVILFAYPYIMKSTSDTKQSYLHLSYAVNIDFFLDLTPLDFSFFPHSSLLFHIY